MTSIPQLPPQAPAGPVRPETPIADPPLPRRRRPWFAVIGVLVMLLGALGAASLVRSAGDRVDVLAVASDVAVGEEITEADLTTAALPKDPALDPVPAGDRGSVVGKRAAANLKAGSLLTRGHVADGQVLPQGQELVAVKVERGRAPTTALAAGDEVRVVATPGESEPVDAEVAVEVDAQVQEVGQPDASGTVVIHLAVPATDSAAVAAQAATGRVAIVLASKG